MDYPRLTPSVAQLPIRIASRDVMVGEYLIPKGAHITVNIYSLHHNPKYWGNDAEEFKPERFDGDVEKQHAYDYIPFSTGTRSCKLLTFRENRVTHCR